MNEPTADVDGNGSVGEAVDEVEELRFRVLNALAMPIWVAMIVAPRSALTRRLVRVSDLLLAGYSVAYVGHLLAGLKGQAGAPEFSSGAMRRTLGSNSVAFHAGWIHYLAFDLFVGRWIWAKGLEEGRSTRLALGLTLMAGPAGLGVFAVQRRSIRSAPPR